MKNIGLKITGCFLAIQFLILLLLRFRGSYHSFYINAYNYFLDSSYFKYDIFLSNSLLFDSTIYYQLLSLIGVEQETDVLLFCIYLVLIFINLYFYSKIIRRFYNPTDKWSVALFLLPALVLGNFLAPNAESALIYSHTGTASQVAFSSILLTIFFTVQHKWRFVIMFSLISLLLSSKHSAFPIFVSFTYFLITQFGYRFVIKLYTIFSLIFIPVVHTYFSLVSEEYIQKNIQLIDFIILRDQHEDAWHLQSARGISKLILGFICLFASIKSIQSLSYKTYLSTIFYLSLIAVFFGAIYTSTLYQFYPEPYLVLLSTVKAMFLMQFFACAGISKLIIESSMNNLSKGIFIAALFFGSFGGQAGENLAIFIIVIGSVLQISAFQTVLKRLLSYSEFQYLSHFKAKIPIDAQIVLVVLSMTIPITANTLNNKLGSYSQYYGGRFTIVDTSNKFLEEVSDLKYCKDFNFLPIEERYFFKNINTNQLQNITNPFLIYFSRKSNYLGDPAHLYLDLETQQKYLKRKANVMYLFNETTSVLEKDKAWNSLGQEQVVLVAPLELIPEYFKQKVSLVSNNFIYIFSSGVKQRDEFIKDCKSFGRGTA